MRRFLPLDTQHLALLLCICLPLSVARAAPTTTEEASASQQDETQSALRSARPTATPGGSRAVDLLIQMQTRSAGLEFNERKPLSDSREMRLRPVAPPDPKSTGAAENGVSSNASGLFGSGATPAVQSSRVSGGETRIDGGAAPGNVSRSPTAAGPAEPPLWMLLPREVVEYVRDNRGFVLGSVSAFLVLLWGLSLAFSRRRN